MKLLNFLFFITIFFSCNPTSRETEKQVVASIFSEALNDKTAYENLRMLCKTAPGRIIGSPSAEKAVELTYRIMKGMGLDTVYKQPVMVPRWDRGEQEIAEIRSGTVKTRVSVASLCLSAGTGSAGLSAQVVEVQNFEQLASLGEKGVRGKIVFYNRPMDPALENKWTAYGQAREQRSEGPGKAAALGAVGVVVRSLTFSLDDNPHTGFKFNSENKKEIPAVAISTKGANLLSSQLKENPGLEFWFRTTCEMHEEVESANVIGEIRGSVYPGQIITIGGHTDAMHIGEGAHDDGVGCVQSIEVLRLFKKLGIRPKRTIRVVMFMDEEILGRGTDYYGNQDSVAGKKHYFALESDNGGFLPRGFDFSGPLERIKIMQELTVFFAPYGINRFTNGGEKYIVYASEKSGIPVASLTVDDSHYFEYHHSTNDLFEHVNIWELQSGSAAMASLVYLVDKLDL